MTQKGTEMLKKMMLLATMVAAVAAFVAPTASAAFEASKWSMGGTELKEAGTIEGTGQLKFNSTSGLGGIECHVIMHGTTTASSGTGVIDGFITSNCMNFGFLATVCGTNATPTSTLNWTVHAQKEGATKRILITAPKIDNTFPEKGANCPNGGVINITGSNAANPVFATPNSTTAATQLTLGGEVETSIGASKAEGTITLFDNKPETATKGGSGTYGIL